MPLGGGETAVAEDTGSHLHVIWVMHSDRGSNAIAEEVRVPGLPSALGAPGDVDAERVWGLRRKAIANPQPVPATALSHKK